jgi:mannose-6-phosphate isomerase-like protein (cupin superfamily)
MSDFPGAVGVSMLRVYDSPGPDGLRGGTPHLHTASAEGYVVLSGSGVVQTITSEGYAETPLAAGTLLWFTPGTVHRLVHHKDLRLLVVMQNAGLPEAGDAILTFPSDVLADPATYAAAAVAPVDESAARCRRDLAVDGFLALRAGGPAALAALYEAAGRLVRDRVPDWRARWHAGPHAQSERTRAQLTALAAGDPRHLHGSRVRVASGSTARLGMCGHLSAWHLEPSFTAERQEESP